MENLNNNLLLSDHFNVFCDSNEALDWAYKKNLPNTAIVYTSSPALLWKKNRHIKHVESRWKIDDMREFQSSIQKFSENIFSEIMSLNYVGSEEALCITRSATIFNRILYKASCLSKDDLTDPRLIIEINGKTGPLGNVMNSPWADLLKDNDKLKVIKYDLNDDNWGKLTTAGVSLIDRFRMGGINTLIYRLAIKIVNFLPIKILKRTVLIYGENELLIDTASKLLFKGFLLKKICISDTDIVKDPYFNFSKFQEINDKIRPIVRGRIKDWADPCFHERCEQIFFDEIYKQISLFYEYKKKWIDGIFDLDTNGKNILLINSPISTKGLSLTSACRDKKIPTVSAQHGVTFEICKTHGEFSFMHDINSTDLYLSYNYASAKFANSNFFSKGGAFVSGISSRHLKLKTSNHRLYEFPIVYVSTNLYKGNIGLFSTWLTDYDRAKNESVIVRKVLSKLPYKVCYKTYPEDNRRYPDKDPVINDVISSNNVELFDRKIDMRFLVNRHRILVTSKATSTLGWLVMSGKPVIFINRGDNMPLTSEAYKEFRDGLFLFDGDKEGFHKELCAFLSKPLKEIELLWKEKKEKRKVMIRNYFSSYSHNSGNRAADYIKSTYLH